MRNTTWQQIQPGQIVRFVYKSQGTSKGEQRTILVIDPKHRYRKKSTGRVVEFVVGLQLDTLLSPPIDIRNFNKLISRYGGLTLDEGVVEVGSNPDRADKNTAEDIYKLLERFLKKNDIFRTYFLRECRKRRVFLLDSYQKFPKKAKDNLALKKRINETIKKIEEF
tara:strand:+ start:2032 stop:2529 length:498 start_codon:yes stop_codon:yes gene_type:complete